MKVNMTTVLTGLDGKVLPLEDSARQLLGQIKGLIVQGDTQGAINAADTVLAKSEPLAIRTVIANSLLQQCEGDANDAGEVKLKRWLLAQKVYGPDDIDLTAEEVTMAKDRIGKMYGAVVVGPAYALLDPASVGVDPAAIAAEA